MKTILVTGDFIVDHNLLRLPSPISHYYDPVPDAVERLSPGGAWYLADLVKAACGDAGAAVHAAATFSEPGDNISPGYPHAYSIWAPYPVRHGSTTRVWRISEFLGCQPAPVSGGAPSSRERVPAADIVVIDDANRGFRDHPDLWPAEVTDTTSTAQILLKTVSPLGEGLLSEHLLAHHAGRVTAVISVLALRARQATISSGLSWDRTIEDVHREVTSGVSSRDLGQFGRLVVMFEGVGAAIYHGTTDGPVLDHFLYVPTQLEAAWQSNMLGIVYGSTSLMVAAMARHMTDPETFSLFAAAGRALDAARLNHEHGGGGVVEGETEELLGSFNPAQTLSTRVAPGLRSGVDLGLESPYYSAFPHHLLSFPPKPDGPSVQSDLLHDLTGLGEEYVAATAQRVVLDGIAEALKPAPRAHYGSFITVDREETEHLNEVRRLLRQYYADPNVRRPLCIAVFGPPGSGKSFAVKELTAEFRAGQKPLEFNLAQFESRDDLHRAFQQVRDASIKGQIPLVFWDEFDSGDLKWLAGFLAPMQDAEFQERGLVQGLGKAVFIFAGGTSFTYQDFDKSKADPASQDSDKAKADAAAKSFTEKKGPDFVSRLRGYLNIQGVNPHTSVRAVDAASGGAGEGAHILRRAILLRSLIDRHYPHLIHQPTGRAAIDVGVIRGFLRAKEFAHGARSIEAILNMSSLLGASRFGVAELPSEDLLSLHVGHDFMLEVEKGALEVGVIEALSRATHEAWLAAKRRTGQNLDNQFLQPYDGLSERDRERNRVTARVTVAKLLDVGFSVVRRGPGAGHDLDPTVLNGVRDTLCKIEHDVWLRDHLLRGYARAAVRNERLHLHPDIAHWDDLDPTEPSLDAAIIACLPQALWDAGYMLQAAIRKAESAEGSAGS